jgi:tetratricopeptide (TPR) repeat protein
MPYTVSDMLSSANETMGAGGGSVSLKRRGEDGVMLDATPAERDLLDTQARVKSAALALQGLDPEQKLAWALSKRAEGDKRFAAGATADAVELYIAAMAGMDFGNVGHGSTAAEEADNAGGGARSATWRSHVQRVLQVPVLISLGACMLATEQFAKATQVLDQALALEPRSAGALLQRARARTALCAFAGARRDLEAVLGGESRGCAVSAHAADGSTAGGRAEQLVEERRRARRAEAECLLARLAKAEAVDQRHERAKDGIARRMAAGLKQGRLYSDKQQGAKKGAGARAAAAAPTVAARPPPRRRQDGPRHRLMPQGVGEWAAFSLVLVVIYGFIRQLMTASSYA